MMTIKPLYLALAGSFVLSIPGQTVQAATLFSGVGEDAIAAFTAMETAIGGSDNTSLEPQADGFRTINWDGVLLDGTDFEGNTQVIIRDQVVAIPEERFLSRGALFDESYVVSGDGLESVNPEVVEQFPAFSPSNIVANSGETENTIEQSFTLAGTTTPAATRGFGAIFLDVERPETSSLEFFNGSVSLGEYFVEPGESGEPSFLGVLFDEPIVTNVAVTLGNNTIFNFDIETLETTSGSVDNPENGIDLVAADDFVYAEPMYVAAAEEEVEIPEPSFLAGLLLVGLLSKRCRKK
ncbi:MAG: PEP-CTERM sorting domain-containing protein [Cyanobacteria bacterium J06592_8]